MVVAESRRGGARRGRPDRGRVRGPAGDHRLRQGAGGRRRRDPRQHSRQCLLRLRVWRRAKDRRTLSRARMASSRSTRKARALRRRRMEPRGALAAYDAASDNFDILCAHQGGPPSDPRFLARHDRHPAKNASACDMLDVGGAFGARTAPFPEYPVMLHLAQELGRPMKWLSTRSEDFLTDNHGRAISLRRRARLTTRAASFSRCARTGSATPAPISRRPAFSPIRSMACSSAPASTSVEAVYGRHRQIITNTAPTNAYRGAGRPEANYIVERLVDEAAATLGHRSAGAAPAQYSSANDQMPYKTPTGTDFRQRRFCRLDRQGEGRRRAGTASSARRKEAARRGASCAASAAACSSSRPAAAWYQEGSGRDPFRAMRNNVICTTWPGRAGRGTRRCFRNWSRAGSASVRDGDIKRRRSRWAGSAWAIPPIGSRTGMSAWQRLTSRRRHRDREGPSARRRSARNVGRGHRVRATAFHRGRAPTAPSP